MDKPLSTHADRSTPSTRPSRDNRTQCTLSPGKQDTLWLLAPLRGRRSWCLLVGGEGAEASQLASVRHNMRPPCIGMSDHCHQRPSPCSLDHPPRIKEPRKPVVIAERPGVQKLQIVVEHETITPFYFILV